MRPVCGPARPTHTPSKSVYTRILMNISELETRLNQLAEQAVAEFAEVERKEDAIQVKNRYLG